jgi:hypothetical protein
MPEFMHVVPISVFWFFLGFSTGIISCMIILYWEP